MRRGWLFGLLLMLACSGGGSTRDDAQTGVDPVRTGDAAMGSADADVTQPMPTRDGGPNVPVDAARGLGADYRMAGESSVTTKTDSFAATGCTLQYGLFEPAQKRSEVTLVITPGFALSPGLGSSREALDGLAQHIASWGITTYTVALCSNGANIDHAKNGAALAAFGEQVAGSRVIYAGFSAGGLGAMIAASQAKNLEAFLALDAVDSDDLAKPALDAIQKPIHALVGEPSSCNNDENMLPQYQGRSLRVIKVKGAQHFIFEGSACKGVKCALCNGGGVDEATAVRALSTAFVLGISGAEPGALSWWQEGSEGFRALQDAGLIESVQ